MCGRSPHNHNQEQRWKRVSATWVSSPTYIMQDPRQEWCLPRWVGSQECLETHSYMVLDSVKLTTVTTAQSI